jgi:hypothetical protein
MFVHPRAEAEEESVRCVRRCRAQLWRFLLALTLAPRRAADPDGGVEEVPDGGVEEARGTGTRAEEGRKARGGRGRAERKKWAEDKGGVDGSVGLVGACNATDQGQAGVLVYAGDRAGEEERVLGGGGKKGTRELLRRKERRRRREREREREREEERALWRQSQTLSLLALPSAHMKEWQETHERLVLALCHLVDHEPWQVRDTSSPHARLVVSRTLAGS